MRQLVLAVLILLLTAGCRTPQASPPSSPPLPSASPAPQQTAASDSYPGATPFVPQALSAEQRRTLQALSTSPEVELFSLEPGVIGPGGTPNKTLGSCVLTGAEKDEVVKAFVDGIEKNDGREAMCFNPRHGLRAGDTAFIICFECQQVYAWVLKPGEKPEFSGSAGSQKFLTLPGAQRVFDKVLTAHKVRLTLK